MLDLIDIGANLTHDSFDADRDAVLARAAAAGVARIIVTGTSVTSSVQARRCARRSPKRLFATAGVHPHHAAEFDEHTTAALRSLLASPAFVAVGECGLDFFRDYSPRDAQRQRFRGAARARGRRRQTRVPASARRARGVRRAARAACARGSPAASRTASPAARRARGVSRARPLHRRHGLGLRRAPRRRAARGRAADPARPAAHRNRRAVPACRAICPEAARPAQRAAVPRARARARRSAERSSPSTSSRKRRRRTPSGSSGSARRASARAQGTRLDRRLDAVPMRRERDEQALEIGLLRPAIALDELGRRQRRRAAGPS